MLKVTDSNLAEKAVRYTSPSAATANIRSSFAIFEERREEGAWCRSYGKGRHRRVFADDHRDDTYRNGMSLLLADAPISDEIAVMVCIAGGGRLIARLTGSRATRLWRKSN
jgi:hypothetical protein